MPGGYKNIRPEDRTNGFDKNPQNIGNGRRKKIYTILKEKGYSSSDIKIAFGEIAFYTLNELKNLYENEDAPIIARIAANQFYQALKKGEYNKVKEILEYSLGKPTQIIETNIGTTKKDIQNLFPDGEDLQPES